MHPVLVSTTHAAVYRLPALPPGTRAPKPGKSTVSWPSSLTAQIRPSSRGIPPPFPAFRCFQRARTGHWPLLARAIRTYGHRFPGYVGVESLEGRIDKTMEAAENPPWRVASTFWRPPNAVRRSKSSIFSERTRVETQVKNLCSCGRESVEEQDGRSAKPSAEPADDGNAQRPISMPGRTPLPCTAPLSPSRSDFPPGDPLLACIYGQGARTQHTGRPTRESRPLVVGPRPCLDVP